MVVVTVVAQDNIDAAGDNIVHCGTGSVGVIGEVALRAEAEVIVGSCHIGDIVVDIAYLIGIPESDVDVVLLTGLHVEDHGQFFAVLPHSLVTLVDHQLLSLLVEDPAFHAVGGLGTGADAVHAGLAGNELSQQASGHDDAVVVEDVCGNILAQLCSVGREGSQTLDGILQLLAVGTVSLEVLTSLQPFLVIGVIEAASGVHSLQCLIQLLVHGADADQVGVGGVVCVLGQQLGIILIANLDLAVVCHIPDGLFFVEVGVVHQVNQQQRAVLVANMVVAVLAVVDDLSIGVLKAVGGNSCLSGDVGGNVDILNVHQVQVFDVDSVVALAGVGVLDVAQSDLICTVLICHHGVAGLPLLRVISAGDGVDGLIVDDDMQNVSAGFRGLQVIKANSLTGFQLDIDVHDGVAVVQLLVGSHQAGFAVLLSEDEGPCVLVFVSTVGDGQFAGAHCGVDLLGRGHLHIGSHLSQQLMGRGQKLLLIVLCGKVVKEAGPQTLGQQCAAFHQADTAVAVHNHRGGIALDIEHIGPGGGASCHIKGQAIGCLEVCHILAGVHGVQGDDGNVVAVLLVSSLHQGELLDTVGAGGVPEVQDGDLLLLQHLGKLDLLAVGSSNGEIIHDIAGSQSGSGDIVRGDQRGSQHDLSGSTVEVVVAFRCVALGHGRQRNVVGACLKLQAHLTVGVSVAVAYHIGQSGVTVNVDGDALHGQTGSILHADGISTGFAGGTGGSLVILLAACSQANKGSDDKEHCQNSLHLVHSYSPILTIQ